MAAIRSFADNGGDVITMVEDKLSESPGPIVGRTSDHGGGFYNSLRIRVGFPDGRISIEGPIYVGPYASAGEARQGIQDIQNKLHSLGGDVVAVTRYRKGDFCEIMETVRAPALIMNNCHVMQLSEAGLRLLRSRFPILSPALTLQEIEHIPWILLWRALRTSMRRAPNMVLSYLKRKCGGLRW